MNNENFHFVRELTSKEYSLKNLLQQSTLVKCAKIEYIIKELKNDQ